jgi:hypothetical protein
MLLFPLQESCQRQAGATNMHTKHVKGLQASSNWNTFCGHQQNGNISDCIQILAVLSYDPWYTLTMLVSHHASIVVIKIAMPVSTFWCCCVVIWWYTFCMFINQILTILIILYFQQCVKLCVSQTCVSQTCYGSNLLQTSMCFT